MDFSEEISPTGQQLSIQRQVKLGSIKTWSACSIIVLRFFSWWNLFERARTCYYIRSVLSWKINGNWKTDIHEVSCQCVAWRRSSFPRSNDTTAIGFQLFSIAYVLSRIWKLSLLLKSQRFLSRFSVTYLISFDNRSSVRNNEPILIN